MIKFLLLFQFPCSSFSLVFVPKLFIWHCDILEHLKKKITIAILFFWSAFNLLGAIFLHLDVCIITLFFPLLHTLSAWQPFVKLRSCPFLWFKHGRKKYSSRMLFLFGLLKPRMHYSTIFGDLWKFGYGCIPRCNSGGWLNTDVPTFGCLKKKNFVWYMFNKM